MIKLKRLGFLLLLNAFCLLGYAQTGSNLTISGKVTDASGIALPGVTVQLRSNTQTGTITDLDGNYTISARLNDYLIFSYIGFETQEIQIVSSAPMNVVMSEGTTELNEVIITVPYGTARRSTFTGSAAVIDSDVISKSQVSNVSKALQGTVAGLQSFSSTGQPGSDATVRIRGIGSVNASSAPLYVVDGVPYDGNLSSIASSDIESISVLKDAASATLYGSRAANGVIMITTKQGRKDQAPTVEISSKFGFSDRARRDYDQLNTNQYFELLWEALRNNRLDNNLSPEAAAEYASANLVGNIGINPYGTNNPQPVGLDGKLKAGLNPLWDDNWIDALSQNARYTDINMRVTGGGSNSRYYVSAGMLNDQGIVIQSGFQRYTLRTNLVSDITKWLQVGINISGTHSSQDYPKQDDSAISNVILFGRGVPSFYPVYERNLETGEYLTDSDGNRIYDYGLYRATSYAGYNLLQSMAYDLSKVTRDAASARAYIHIEPIEDLTWRTSVNVDYNSRFDHNFTNPTYGSGSRTGGGVSKSNTRTVGMTFNNVVNYSKDFGNLHSMRLMGGQEYYEYNASNFGGSRDMAIMVGFMEPSASALVSGFYGTSDKYKLLSFFGSGEYSYDRKYFLSASARSDGSSRFHPDKRWGTFWSVGASWRIVEESFMQNAKDTWLSNLMLRTSYGAQGNDNIGYYAYQALYSIQNNLGEAGLRATRLATPNLTWETNLNLNIGLDFALWRNRMSGSIEYFERSSKDLLFSKNLVPSTGFSSTSENIGKIKNYGWEASIEGYPISTNDWRWKLGANATAYKNRIVSLPSPVMWSGTKKWVEGGSLYDFYLVEWAGVNPENGNPQWYRYSDGEKIVTEDFSSTTSNDRVLSGSSLPKISGGFQSDLSYKGISLSALFSYTLGGKIYNRDKISLYTQGRAGNAWSVDMLNRWTPENRDTDVPRLTTEPRSSWTNQSTRFLIDRSFLRLKTVTLSYALPQSFINSIRLKNADIFLQAENLLTFTKEQGVDPEQTFDGTTYYRYPAMKTISFGFNVKL